MGAILRDENSVLPLELSQEEEAQFRHSAQTLKDVIGQLKV